MLPNLQGLDYISQVSQPRPGKPFMLECFATWCGPCRQMIPHIAQMTKQFPNVFIVSVSANEPKETVQRLAQTMPIMRQYNLAVDPTGSVSNYMQQNGVNGIPHCFVYHGNGQLAFSGHPAEPQLQNILQELNIE